MHIALIDRKRLGETLNVTIVNCMVVRMLTFHIAVSWDKFSLGAHWNYVLACQRQNRTSIQFNLHFNGYFQLYISHKLQCSFTFSKAIKVFFLNSTSTLILVPLVILQCCQKSYCFVVDVKKVAKRCGWTQILWFFDFKTNNFWPTK